MYNAPCPTWGVVYALREMIYPSNFEQRVGFDRIREQIVERCSMLSARELMAEEGFTRSRRESPENARVFPHENREFLICRTGRNMASSLRCRPARLTDP